MSVPAVVLLHLNQRRLPAEVFDRLMARSDSRRDRERKAEEAWENFGKPGRDPDTLGGVLGTIAGESHWVPHLKVAQLRTQWNLVVGDAIAAHSQVADFRDGVLTIRAESPVWATQLNYLVPQLTATIRERLAGLDIERIQVTGPRQSQGRYVHMRRWGR